MLILDTLRDAIVEPDTDDSQPSQIAAAAANHGMDLVDHDTHESLKRDAVEGRRIAAAARQKAIEASVDKAIDRGASTLARRKNWITLLQNDDTMADVLAGIADQTAVPIGETGHAADVTRDDHDLAEAGQWFY